MWLWFIDGSVTVVIAWVMIVFLHMMQEILYLFWIVVQHFQILIHQHLYQPLLIFTISFMTDNIIFFAADVAVFKRVCALVYIHVISLKNIVLIWDISPLNVFVMLWKASLQSLSIDLELFSIDVTILLPIDSRLEAVSNKRELNLSSIPMIVFVCLLWIYQHFVLHRSHV